MNVLIISDLPEQTKERISECFPSSWEIAFSVPGQEASFLSSANVIIPEHVVMDAAYLSRCPHLEMIQTGAGYDNIDLPACKAVGVVVCHASGVNANAVAEHTMALILSWFKNIAPAQYHPGSELSGLTIGIAGFGAVGQRVARLCEAFEMRVLRYSHRPESCDTDFHSLLHSSDIVSLHVPLTQETRHMVGKQEFEIMKNTALLVNTSRGAVVDEAELIRALQQNELAGACLDVFEHEPLPQDSPLRVLPNVLLTHHTAGYPDGPKFHRKRYQFFADNIQRLEDGLEPRNRLI